MQTIEWVRTRARGADALVAVGSGTVNDVAKYASFLDGKPFAVFGTAPSMNGYTSTTVALSADGFKRSLPAHAATGVFLDLAILAAFHLRNPRIAHAFAQNKFMLVQASAVDELSDETQDAIAAVDPLTVLDAHLQFYGQLADVGRAQLQAAQGKGIHAAKA